MRLTKNVVCDEQRIDGVFLSPVLIPSKINHKNLIECRCSNCRFFVSI